MSNVFNTLIVLSPCRRSGMAYGVTIHDNFVYTHIEKTGTLVLRRLSTKAHTLQSCSHKLKIAPSKKRAGLTQFQFAIQSKLFAVPIPVLFTGVLATIAVRLSSKFMGFLPQTYSSAARFSATFHPV